MVYIQNFHADTFYYKHFLNILIYIIYQVISFYLYIIYILFINCLFFNFNKSEVGIC